MTRWVVDGMNVIGSRPTGWWRDRLGAMRALAEELRQFARASGDPVTVIFDGRPFDLAGGAGVDVAFASRRGGDAADDDIARLVAESAQPEDLTVVTSDATLAERVRSRGAAVLGAGSFRAKLDEAARTTADPRYAGAFLDWLACASRGRREPAARAAAALGDPVLAAATAGHVLDYDDTYLPGIAHLSAPTAPAALLLGAELGRSLGDVLHAYAAGFEAMGALARASHPALYDGGFHPTAVCGGVGAAVAAARLLGLEHQQEETAKALALVGAGGLRAAFGSDGKSLQVGFAAAGGVRAARLARAGTRMPLDAAANGFTQATRGRHADPDPGAPAIERNWIKAWPCCLQTHGSIEAAQRVRDPRPRSVAVTVHPVSLQAAAYGPDVNDGLQAKFSIPYLTAYTLLHGAPTVESFGGVDPDARRLAEAVEVRTDRALLESEAVLSAVGKEIARVEAALGSPDRPMDARALSAKVEHLTGGELDGLLDDPARPAAEVAALGGLR